jgi:hypothetical protein
MTAANTAAASQAAIAQEQWQTQKEYLPEAMQLARDQNTRAQRQADLAESDSAYYRGISQHQFDRSKLSEKYQDRLMTMADEADSGQAGNDEANRANADVEQAYGTGMGTMTRNANRMGVNPGSGSFAAGMQDMTNEKALVSAGAQTNARTQYRDRATALVAAAAGAGQTAFGNGASTGSMAGGSGAGGVGLSAAGMNSMGGVNQNYNAGMGSAGNNFNGAGAAWRANAIESAKNPGFDFVAGLATSGAKAFAMSDRRLKTDIKKVGVMGTGLPVYTYRYKAGGPTVMGVMADEVERINPDAVVKRARGKYDAVDYAAL